MHNHPEVQIIERLARVEEKIDHFIDRMIYSHERHNDHEGRIRLLESGSNRMTGISATIVFIVSVFGTMFANGFML